MATEMEFGLLGPLTVRAGGVPVPLPQGKQRVLLAALLLAADRAVSLDDLAEVLWGSYPPPSARVTIQNYVRRLRKALGDIDGTRIVTHPHGYAITVAAAELDLAQFTAGLSVSQAAARDGAWETAAIQARAALSLWRGAPLADVDSDLLAQRDVPRLGEMRLQALETRIDAELRLGYDAQLITELRQLTAEHPLREHLRAQLMLALYRDGRQAEALAAYAEAREVLVERLGADPGPELRDLHQRMLTADPALILSAAPGNVTGTAAGVAEGAPGRAPSPYRGLAAFSEGDAEFFFGRENATAQVLGRLSTALTETGLVVVSGVSGAGKSSLLRAGVLPQLRHFGLATAPEAASWPRVVLSPGSDPLSELAVRIAPLASIDAAALRDRLATDPTGFALTARQAALAGTTGPTATGPTAVEATGAPAGATQAPSTEPAAGAGGAAFRAPIPANAESRRVLLVVDQCEQLFTVCESAAEREAFVTALHAAASGPRPSALVVLVIRADFEARLADFPELSAAVQDRYLLTAMTARQLRLAITRPAAAVGAQVDEDLVRVLLDEFRAGTSTAVPSIGTSAITRPGGQLRVAGKTLPGEHSAPGRPGMAGGNAVPGGHGGAGLLPLLSHALDQAWRNHTGETLTLVDYERTGGIEGAVAASAQRAYDSLTLPQQEAARHVFTRLTATGDDGTDTAARVPRADLTGPDVEAVLETFAAERLLTLDTDTVEITHEALLTAWPLLRDTWLADARTDRVVRTRLQATATEWDQSGRDSSYLYAGTRLDTAESTAARIASDPRHAPLNRPETDFLRASRRVWRRRARTRHQLIALLLALIAGLTAVVIVAVRAGQATATQRDIAASRLLVNESESTGESNATASDLEALAAWGLDPSPQAQEAMLSDAASPEIGTIATGSSGVAALAVSPDGTIATVGTTGPLQFWDIATGHEIGGPISLLGTAYAHLPPVVGFSSGGRTLVTYDNAAVQLWDATTGHEIGKPIDNSSAGSDSIALSPDGRTLALVNGSNTLQLLDAATGRAIGRPIGLAPSDDQLDSVLAFSKSGKILATIYGNGPVRLWDVPAERLIGTLPAFDLATFTSAVFSPDGKILATLDQNGTVQLWDTATRRQAGGLLGNPGTVSAIAFSPDADILATGSDDGTVRLWNVTTRQQIGQTLGNEESGGTVNSITFSPDGTTLITGNIDGTVRLWNVSLARQIITRSSALAGPTTWVAFSPDGTTLLTYTNAAQRWDITTGRTIGMPFAVHPNRGSPVVMLSPNGETLAIGSSDDGAVHLWDMRTEREIGSPLRAEGNVQLYPVAFSPDSKTLATATSNGLLLWDVATSRPVSNSLSGVSGTLGFTANGDILTINYPFGPAQVRNMATGKPIGSFAAQSYTINFVALSPDGKTLVIGRGDDSLQLWNVTTRQQITTIPNVDDVQQAAFSPNGEVLVTTDQNGNAQAWDAVTGQQIGSSFSGIPSSSMAFSPDGRTLAIVNDDGTVQLWDVSYLTNPLGTLCARIGGTVTKGEWAKYVPTGPAYRNPCASAA